MRHVRRGLAVALFLGLVLVSVELIRRNGDPVVVDLVLIRLEAGALWKLLAATFGLGFASALLVVGFGWLLARLETRRYRKEVRRLESELHQLRSLPLAESNGDEESVDAPTRVQALVATGGGRGRSDRA